MYRSKGKTKVFIDPAHVSGATDTRARELKDRYSSVRRSYRAHDEDRVLERFLESLSTDYLPLAVIVNEQMEPLHILGETEGYFKVPAGKPTNDITKMAAKELSIPLSTGIQKVFRQGQELKFSNIHLHALGKTVDLRIRMLPPQKDQEPLVAVLLVQSKRESTGEKIAATFNYDVSKEAEQRLRDLEQELQFSSENLQATIEELETSNEELQATNEELLASNEELQSTNEELHNDVDNLLTASHMGKLILDENMEIRRFPEMTATIFKLLDSDVGRPITHLSHYLVGVDPAADIKRVQATSTELAHDSYARLYNQSPVGYISLDESGLIRKANQTFLDMIGLGDDDVKGLPLSECLLPDDREIFLGRYSAIFRHPEAKTIDLRLKSRNAFRVVRLSAAREEKGKTLLVIVNDITERKLADDKIEALLEEKKLLLREVHHRIKNNLNVATSLLTIQADRIENPEGKAALENARGRMTSMMLIYDRLYRSGDIRNISAAEYLSQLLDALSEQFASPRITVERQFEDFLMDSNTLSPLGIILNELLTNAYKYAFPDGRHGTISVRLSRKGNDAAELAIADDGPGIPESFDENGSKGFGLFLIRALVDQIEGSLSISREHGAEFVILFPAPSVLSGQMLHCF